MLDVTKERDMENLRRSSDVPRESEMTGMTSGMKCLVGIAAAAVLWIGATEVSGRCVLMPAKASVIQKVGAAFQMHSMPTSVACVYIGWRMLTVD